MRLHAVFVLMVAYIAFEKYVIGTTFTKYEEKQVTIASWTVSSTISGIR